MILRTVLSQLEFTVEVDHFAAHAALEIYVEMIAPLCLDLLELRSWRQKTYLQAVWAK